MWNFLVVDDNFLNRKLILEILKGVAHCDVAENGKQALSLYDQKMQEGARYDLLLLDVAMPEMSGIDVLKSIRAKEKEAGLEGKAKTAVLMVTAYKDPFLEAFSEGCDDYVLKPIQPDVLINKVQRMLHS